MQNCTQCLYRWGPDDVCPPGWILPIFDEREWNITFRSVLYLLVLLYFFVGVAIVTDMFMASIEVITSTSRKVYLAKTERNGSETASEDEDPEDEPGFMEIRVWNDTVANLTLLVIGTSASEIMLSIIEIVKRNFESEELGPSTIVGAAAYNLLVVTSLCMFALDVGEIRRIKRYSVFVTTSIFSILPYIWIVIITRFITPNVVTVWEAAVTVISFPILVAIAYLADRGFCGFKVHRHEIDSQYELGPLLGERTQNDLQKCFKGGRLVKRNLAHFMREIKRTSGTNDEEVAALAAAMLMKSKPHSSTWYRLGAVRKKINSRKVQPELKPRWKKVTNTSGDNSERESELSNVPDREKPAIIEFRAASITVKEDVGRFPVTIIRRGNLEPQVRVRVRTIDGSARSVEDYMPINEIITFEAHQCEKQIFVEIVYSDVWEPEEEFYLRLSLVNESNNKVELGVLSIMEISILDESNPGKISFEKRGILVKESAGNVKISVVRCKGTDGEVSIDWKTIDITSLSGRDYIGGTGTLTFKDTESRLVLLIPIIDNFLPEKDQYFEVELFNPTNGARLGKINKIAVTIADDDQYNTVMERVINLTMANLDELNVQHKSWTDQVKTAMNVNGGDVANASCADYAMHFFCFFWKVLFALLPPPQVFQGWLCFFVSLVVIAVMTAIIGDIAKIFGCLVGLPDAITAITLVSIGTSIPDTLACRMVTRLEPTADSAMIHCTGAIAVNALIGMGLPWLLAAVYHYTKGTVFHIPPGSMGFSVILYCVAATVAFLFLFVRRRSAMFGKAEIGGPTLTRYLTSAILISLWLTYIILSWFQAFNDLVFNI